MRNGTTHLVTGGGAASFATITGSPGDNAALVAALALKLNKEGTATLAYPVCVAVRNIPVLTAGAPSDIATIVLPTWLTRWAIMAGTGSANSRIIAETAVGTLASATFGVYDAANGTGNLMTSSATTSGPTAAGLASALLGSGISVVPSSTSGTIYIRQAANSANAGTVSFYFTLLPIIL